MGKMEPQKVEVPISIPVTVPISVPIDVTTNTTSNEKLMYLREKLEKEHSLLNDRSNIFLIWQSILIAGLAIGGSNVDPRVYNILIVLGIVSSLLWLYIGRRGKLGADFYWKKLKKIEDELPLAEERLFINAEDARKKHKCFIFRLAITDIFAYVVPIIWLLVWLVTLNFLWLKFI